MTGTTIQDLLKSCSNDAWRACARPVVPVTTGVTGADFAVLRLVRHGLLILRRCQVVGIHLGDCVHFAFGQSIAAGDSIASFTGLLREGRMAARLRKIPLGRGRAAPPRRAGHVPTWSRMSDDAAGGSLAIVSAPSSAAAAGPKRAGSSACSSSTGSPRRT